MIDKNKIKIKVIPKFFGNFVAITPLPNTIFVVKGYENNPQLIAHELVHVEQWSEHGWKFLPKYLWSWVRGGFKYSNIHFEKEAVSGESRLLTLAKEIIDEQART